LIRLQRRLILITAAVMSLLLLLQACGQNNGAEGSGESFAAAADASILRTDEPAEAQATAAPQASARVPQVSAEASPSVENSPEEQTANMASGSAIAEAVPTVPPFTSQPSPKPAASASPVHSLQPAASPSQPAEVANTAATSSAGKTDIDWSGFFDGDNQTRPSERFWDLSGSTVTIKGFMGEVLSFEKNWFLLIPEPGAECPFDNGDETYWNKIMIVFVPEGSKLRHTSGPLEISGRLDVGIKIDESGYKTMFRLYDASFKSL
jgi:hypothetical protein